jgi:hypothetical protein
MPAEGEPIDSCALGAPGNEPAYPRVGAEPQGTDPSVDDDRLRRVVQHRLQVEVVIAALVSTYELCRGVTRTVVA